MHSIRPDAQDFRPLLFPESRSYIRLLRVSLFLLLLCHSLIYIAIRAESTQSMINTNWAPMEEDFRDMPIFPTTEEILGIKSGELNPRLRASIFIHCNKTNFH
jgi:hypothetical protein